VVCFLVAFLFYDPRCSSSRQIRFYEGKGIRSILPLPLYPKGLLDSWDMYNNDPYIPLKLD
jgi:hypothetical protein